MFMTRILSLFIAIVALCGFCCAAQEPIEVNTPQSEADSLQCNVDSLLNEPVFIAREPMTPADSLRYTVDCWLNNNNNTVKQTRTKTVTKTVKGKRGKRRNRTVQVKVPYTVNVQKHFTVGCCIYDLTADTLLYTYNADRMMIPASTQKLYVATTMLDKRGPDFSFNTSAYTDGKVMADSAGRRYLNGNIYITTSCDPTLDKYTPDKILRDIRSLQVDSINGQVMQCLTPQSVKCKLAEDAFASDIALKLVKDSVAMLYPKAAEDWIELNKMNGGMTRISHISTPLDDVLERMLKRSNNTYAECVLLNVCDNNNNWTYDACRGAVNDLVARIYKQYNTDQCDDLSISYYNIIDGSGLSHSNKTSARSQVDLLRYIFANKDIFNVIYSHLPVAGVSGTLSKRMTDGFATGNVHAKTGTVNNTKTLSGYVSTANFHRLAFSILVNDCSDASFAKRIQDKICEFLAGLEI